MISRIRHIRLAAKSITADLNTDYYYDTKTSAETYSSIPDDVSMSKSGYRIFNGVFSTDFVARNHRFTTTIRDATSKPSLYMHGIRYQKYRDDTIDILSTNVELDYNTLRTSASDALRVNNSNDELITSPA